MEANDIRQYILATFDDVHEAEDEDSSFFFYDTDNRIPFATIVASDKYDTYSDLDRRDIFRLNIGIGKQTFRSMFPVDSLPTESGYDFTAQDVLMPHPEYGRVYWVCVLNPSRSTFDKILPLLADAYEIAVRKYNAARAVKAS
jgi:hypothetical protein